MSATSHASKSAGPIAVLAGILVGFFAWLLPAHFRSLSQPLLRSAGHGTPTVAQFGEGLVSQEKIGAAALVLDTANLVQDPGAAQLKTHLDQLKSRQPQFTVWGGWDPFLDPLFNLRSDRGQSASTPVITFFITADGRHKVSDSLANSGSIGVQAIVRTRELSWSAGPLVAANRGGGEVTESLVLLTGLLYQGDHLSRPLQQELHNLADTALAKNDLGELGTYYLDLLALARRLDWGQLSELLGRTQSVHTVAEYAQLARAASDVFPQIYTAALFTDSADQVAAYLLRYGKTGADDLKLALGDGEGAVRVLIQRQLPVIHTRGPVISAAAAAVLDHPAVMLFVKYLGFFFAGLLILLGLDRWMVSPEGVTEADRAAPQLRSGILALFLAGLCVVATEPYLLKAASSADYRPRLNLPMLVIKSATPPVSSHATPHPSMNTSTLITIGIFALLQVIMYFVCLQKINQIARQEIPPLLKLRLMENEENLFDCGLYVGMMGTAAALVLQVLGVISPNLLAAYSSNLFGLLCVALVKIRHVRLFKKRLILEHETGLRATPA